MRAAILGAAFPDDAGMRLAYGRAMAELTHRDPRAVEGALFVAELAAECGRADPRADRFALVETSLGVVQQPELAAALRQARDLAASGVSTAEAARALGSDGYVVHSVSLATFCFACFGDEARSAVVETIAAGGDTDTNAAIVGALVGALHGPRMLPRDLLRRILGGPFGPAHLQRLALALGNPDPGGVPGYSVAGALLRNLAIFPVVLLHALRRLLP
jgi:ADP-ribosylglycohydrolase